MFRNLQRFWCKDIDRQWSDQCISPQPPCFWYRDAVSKRMSDNNSIRFQTVSHEYQIYPPTQARWDFKLHRNYSNCATIFGRGQRVFKIIVWRKFFQKLFQTRYYTVKKSYFFILDSGSTRGYDCSSAIHIFSWITILKSLLLPNESNQSPNSKTVIFWLCNGSIESILTWKINVFSNPDPPWSRPKIIGNVAGFEQKSKRIVVQKS